MLVGKIFPLYLLIGLGYLAGKHTGLSRSKVASLLIYVLVPLVVFRGVATTDLSPAIISLPALFYVLCCLIALTAHRISRRWWPNNTRNIFSFMAGDGNTGYFGIPVTVALFGEQYLGVAVLSALGFMLFENTLGFYLVARGNFTVKESLKRIATLPTFYAFLLGVFANYTGFTIQSGLEAATDVGRFGYTVLGMMIIGLAVAGGTIKALDGRLIAASFVAKFLGWPIIVGLLIVADTSWFHIYDTDVHKVMVLMSIVPIAANTVALASLLRVQPEKAAITVVLSTLFALIYIPLVIGLLKY